MRADFFVDEDLPFAVRREIAELEVLTDGTGDPPDACLAGARGWLRDALAALRRELVSPTLAGLAATLASVRDARANLVGILSGRSALAAPSRGSGAPWSQP